MNRAIEDHQQRPGLLVTPGLSHARHRQTEVTGRRYRTYLEALSEQCQTQPDDIFLKVDGRQLTFKEVADESTRMAHTLLSLGVRKGDPVVGLLDNSADTLIAFFAANKIGAIWAPVNTAYSGEFLRHQVADARAALVICEAHYLDAILEIQEQLPDVTHIFVRQGDPCGESLATLKPFSDLFSDNLAPIDLPIASEDIACLMYTSGTTGLSKGCMMSHSFLLSTAQQRNRCIPPLPGDVTWSCLPLFHTAAICTVVLSNLLAGRTAAIGARFSVSGFWQEIEQTKATSVTLLASMLPLLAHAPDDPAMLRCRGQIRALTGVPLSEADQKIWRERFGVEYIMCYGYGQTEANMISCLDWGEPLPPPGSMGPPTKEYEVMVVDAEDFPVAVGETGELVVRPTQPGAMFSGYWHNAAASLSGMRDLWWHTGDFVRMDSTGYLYFVDRKKDYLRSRGENISSYEVESAMLKHPLVSEVACHTVPGDAGREEELKATVIIKPGAALTESAFFNWCQQSLPYFALTRFIEFRRELPRNPTGRVLKQQLREEGVTAATWDCEAAGMPIRRKK